MYTLYIISKSKKLLYLLYFIPYQKSI